MKKTNYLFCYTSPAGWFIIAAQHPNGSIAIIYLTDPQLLKTWAAHTFFSVVMEVQEKHTLQPVGLPGSAHSRVSSSAGSEVTYLLIHILERLQGSYPVSSLRASLVSQSQVVKGKVGWTFTVAFHHCW